MIFNSPTTLYSSHTPSLTPTRVSSSWSTVFPVPNSFLLSNLSVDCQYPYWKSLTNLSLSTASRLFSWLPACIPDRPILPSLRKACCSTFAVPKANSSGRDIYFTCCQWWILMAWWLAITGRVCLARTSTVPSINREDTPFLKPSIWSNWQGSSKQLIKGGSASTWTFMGIRSRRMCSCMGQILAFSIPIMIWVESFPAS